MGVYLRTKFNFLVVITRPPPSPIELFPPFDTSKRTSKNPPRLGLSEHTQVAVQSFKKQQNKNSKQRTEDYTKCVQSKQ